MHKQLIRQSLFQKISRIFPLAKVSSFKVVNTIDINCSIGTSHESVVSESELKKKKNWKKEQDIRLKNVSHCKVRQANIRTTIGEQSSIVH